MEPRAARRSGGCFEIEEGAEWLRCSRPWSGIRSKRRLRAAGLADPREWRPACDWRSKRRGTTTWAISSQSLWQHGMGELLAVGALLAATAPPTSLRLVAAGIAAGLLSC